MTDEALWQRFATQEITHAEWNHVLHVRTAFLHAARWRFDEAHLRLRAGIIRLNQRHGLEESGSRGYFETLTRVWLLFVVRAAASSQATTSMELLARCPELLDRQLPLAHYSKELIASTRARAIFVEPDLAPLPPLPATLI
jgi:hypothetical protein